MDDAFDDLDDLDDLDEFEEEELIDLNEVLDALLDTETTFPPRFLYRLSGLEELELEKFIETWPDVALSRRERLLQDMEALADNTTYLDFDQIFLLGLKESGAHSRIISIRGLWESEDPEVAVKLQDILSNDPETDVRAQAACGLGKFVYLGEFEEIDDQLYTQIKNQLLEAAKSGTPEKIRRGALESLGFSSISQLSPLIEAAFEQGKEDWLISALVAIGRTADDQWVHMVIESLNHESPTVRLEAVQAAGLLAAQSATMHMLHLIDDPEEDVRHAAIWALSEIGGLDARAALEGLMRNATEDDEIELLEEALENLNFTEMSINFDLFDLTEEDLEDMLDDEPDNLKD